MNTTALAIADNQTEFTQGQVATLRQIGVDNATREDLAVFFHVVRRTGLDPFARQIYMVGRWSKQGTKFTIQTGIDGYRLIARRAVDRTRETLGYEDTLWCGTDGKWVDVWLSKEPPAAAKVTVLRNGSPYSAVALFSEYAQTTKDGSLTQMWREKGALMIAKCAEALALRKAFPQDLSGLYTAEEMAQADNDYIPAPAPERVPPVQQRRTSAEKLAAVLPQAEPAESPDWIGMLGMLDENDAPAIRSLWKQAKDGGADEWTLDTIASAGTAAVAATPKADVHTGELVEDEAVA